MKSSSRTLVAQASAQDLVLRGGDLPFEVFLAGSGLAQLAIRLPNLRFQSGPLSLAFGNPAVEFRGLGNQGLELAVVNTKPAEQRREVQVLKHRCKSNRSRRFGQTAFGHRQRAS